ncbi:MAG: GWxTD domain-containing protein [Acidobacteria bacterium]|nr:GWxTD domain-containing protein [Acidobacteriota bacterium]MCA1636757.1 GWxTD domain-containing protein [Acidobacteriota bacterium]
MKNKFLAIVFLTAGCLVTAASRAEAQQSSVSFNKTGVSVIFKVETSSSEATKQSSDSLYYTSYDETEKESRVHRVLADRASGAYFGYDLIVESTSVPAKYKISIKPLSINPPKEMRMNDLTLRLLPKYPAEMIVEDGDTIALDILVNSQTQVKIVDLIKVTTKKPQEASSFSFGTARGSGFNPSSSSVAKSGSIDKRAARDFTPNDVTLRLTAPKLLVNGAVGAFPGSNWNGGMIEGSIIFLYVPGKGRFVFSLFPHDNFNFQKDAVIENNKITFRSDNERYELISKAPIVNNGGNWNLWILNDPAYKPDLAFSSTDDDNIQYGAADGVEHLLGRNAQARRRIRAAAPVQRDMKAVYQKWVDEDVRYLITDAEKQTFSQLNGDEEREQFIKTFWKRRDRVPETDENEFRREYYNRIAYANQKFAFGETAGWMTDRGRIFITHGKPDNIQKTDSGEIWTYKSLTAVGDNVRFEFVDNARNGDFRLRQ